MIAMLLLLAMQTSDVTSDPPRLRHSDVRNSLEAAELRFFHLWGEAYRASTAVDEYWQSVRGVMRSCPWVSVSPVDSASRRAAHMIGETPANGRCPSWSLDTKPLGSDEALGIDRALDARFHDAVRADRGRLIARFDSAATLFPGDEWILGQRVRLLIDQRRPDLALGVASNCSASSWRCFALQGYASYTMREYGRADDFYQQAERSMPASVKCEWTNVASLLPEPDRRAYLAEDCDTRLAVTRTTWWLADPLWTDAVNERRVEHYARMTNIMLRTELERDERWSWDSRRGGEALAEMVVRYGWPAQISWGGEANDDANSGRVLLAGGSPNGPYTTFEYVQPRYHFLPKWRAIRNPLSAVEDDWSITAARYRAATDGAGEPEVLKPLQVSSIVAQQWWPEEHSPFRSRMHDLEPPAVVFLRRQQGAVIAVATGGVIAGHSRSDRVSAARGELLWSDAPEHVLRRDSLVDVHDGYVALHAEIPSAPALISVELDVDSGRVNARSRFAVRPPPSLADMRSADRAVSDIVLLRLSENADVEHETSRLLRSMAPSQSVARAERVGLYWETYGYDSSDTLDVAIIVRRLTPQGALRQLGIAFNLAADLNTPIAISWRRPHTGSALSIGPDDVPILPHSMVLNMEALAPGEYELMVVVRKQGESEVASRRELSVVRQ